MLKIMFFLSIVSVSVPRKCTNFIFLGQNSPADRTHLLCTHMGQVLCLHVWMCPDTFSTSHDWRSIDSMYENQGLKHRTIDLCVRWRKKFVFETAQ